MKRTATIFMLMILVTVFVGAQRYSGVIVATAAPQNFTTSWVDCGSVITTGGYKYLHIYFKVDINLSTDTRFRLVTMLSATGDDIYRPLVTVSAGVAHFVAEYYELDTDADGWYHISFGLSGGTPFAQFQISTGTVGGTAGQVDEAYYFFSY